MTGSNSLSSLQSGLPVDHDVDGDVGGGMDLRNLDEETTVFADVELAAPGDREERPGTPASNFVPSSLPQTASRNAGRSCELSSRAAWKSGFRCCQSSGVIVDSL